MRHLDGLLQHLEEGCGMDLRIIHQTLGVDPDQGADSGFLFFLSLSLWTFKKNPKAIIQKSQ